MSSNLEVYRINRAPPKAQSPLLEAMQERQVTIGHDPMIPFSSGEEEVQILDMYARGKARRIGK